MPQRTNVWLWLGPLCFMALIGLYFVMRFEGRWAEQDSAVFTKYIQALVDDGRLVSANSEPYPNGYGYQAISAFLVTLTGLSVPTLQQLIYPVTAALLVLPAWVLYRELTGSAAGATLAAILLFTQPEFLFVILRSSHEKFTRTLLLLCLFCLVRSLRARHQTRLFATYVSLFYLAAFAFIASNNLLAHSFIFAVALAFGIGWILEQWRPGLRQHSSQLMQRLPYATLICLGLVYLFTFYLYKPAQHDLLVLQTLADRIAALFLDVQTQPANAYSQVSAGWISLPAYFLVSSANWVILGTSFAIWLRQSWRWLVRKKQPPTDTAWLVWLFYTAFAAQGVISILADASGALGSNLQHRLFPSISIVAVALVSTALVQWRPRRFAVPVRFILAIGVGCIAVLSVLKATNEPLLSNKWTFYRSEELTAIEWADQNLRNDEIWTELDERLAMAYVTTNIKSAYGNRLYANDRNPTTRNLVISDITRLRSQRLQRPLPLPPDALRVYDNGEAELYHVRPRTPYQR